MHAHRLDDDVDFAAEETEKRDFVDAGSLSHSPRGRPTESVVGVELCGGAENLFAGWNSHFLLDDQAVAENRAIAATQVMQVCACIISKHTLAYNVVSNYLVSRSAAEAVYAV